LEFGQAKLTYVIISHTRASHTEDCVMSITKLRATRIGVHAYRYLSEESRTGSVVSTFRLGFNVLFGEDADARIISYQTQDVPLHPWAIELPGTPPLLQAKLPCFTTRRRSTRFSSGLITYFAGATVHELRVEPWGKEQIRKALESSSRIGYSLKAMFPSRLPLRLEAYTLSTIVRRCLPNSSHMLTELVGRGSGSTPAGDDMLVGMLASLVAQAAVSQQSKLQLATLQAVLHSINLGKRTTRSSAQMLNAALEGSFPEPLCALVRDLKRGSPAKYGLQKSIDRVLGLGATSGWYFLLGFMTACPNSDIPLPGLNRGTADID
jgi:hypothetical protein